MSPILHAGVIRYLGGRIGFDASVEACHVSRQGLGVGSQVDNDGPRRVEPLQGALRAAEVDLLHIPAVRLVAQAAVDERTDMSRHALKRDQRV